MNISKLSGASIILKNTRPHKYTPTRRSGEKVIRARLIQSPSREKRERDGGKKKRRKSMRIIAVELRAPLYENGTADYRDLSRMAVCKINMTLLSGGLINGRHCESLASPDVEPLIFMGRCFRLNITPAHHSLFYRSKVKVCSCTPGI